jgi:hypothetical protein
VLYRIYELRWPRPGKDRQKENSRKRIALVLYREYTGVPGPEMGKQE